MDTAGFNFFEKPRIKNKQKHITQHYLPFYPHQYFHLRVIVRLPRRIAFHTHIQILQIVVVISNINDLRIGDLFCICFTRPIRTFQCVYARESRVQFGIFIDNMIIHLFSFFQLRVHNTDLFLRKRIVAKSTRTAIIRQFVAVLGIDLDIEHIRAFRTEFHCGPV